MVYSTCVCVDKETTCSCEYSVETLSDSNERYNPCSPCTPPAPPAPSRRGPLRLTHLCALQAVGGGGQAVSEPGNLPVRICLQPGEGGRVGRASQNTCVHA